METYELETRFGPVTVRVYRVRGGWRALPIGHHLLPLPPVTEGPLAQCVEDAVAQLAHAIEQLQSSSLVVRPPVSRTGGR